MHGLSGLTSTEKPKETSWKEKRFGSTNHVTLLFSLSTCHMCPKIQTLQFLGDIGSTAYFVVVLHFVMGVRLSLWWPQTLGRRE